MNRYIAALLLATVAAQPVAAAENVLNLSIKEALKLGVEKNLDVKAELYNPAQAEAELRKSKGIYDPHLTLSTSYLDSTTYSASLAATGGPADYEQQIFKINPGINKLLPYGGTVGLTFNNTYTSTNPQSSLSLSKYWQSDLTLSLSQPLLKNFGRDVTEQNIRIAALSREGSMKRFKGKVLSTVAQVRSEYNRLFSLREDLKSKNVSLELANKVLVETKARVNAGVLPAMEVLNAQFGAASREKDLIDAEKAVHDQEDVLRVLLQLEGGKEIVPVDPPSLTEYPMSEDDALKRALAERYELDDLKTQLETYEIQSRTAKNRTKPDLNLTTSIAMTGLGDGYGRDMERVTSTNYPVWSIGLQFDYPFGNSAAENDYIKSRLKVDQTKTQIDGLRSSIASEVRTAIRAVQSSFKQLDVADRGRAYAEERLKAYMKKNEVGLATTKDVLDVENELSTARSNQIKAQTAYATAVSLLWKSTGELLDREGIRVESRQADDLYERSLR